MAEWQRNSLADTGASTQLAEQGEAAITTVQSVLQIVQGGAEVAKIFLTGIANPAAVAAAEAAAADMLVLDAVLVCGVAILLLQDACGLVACCRAAACCAAAPRHPRQPALPDPQGRSRTGAAHRPRPLAPRRSRRAAERREAALRPH